MDLSRFVYKPSLNDNSISNQLNINNLLIQTKKRKVNSLNSFNSIGLSELYVTPGELEVCLNLLIVGINPSYQSWSKGHYYANPVNRMWSLLIKSKLIPSYFTYNDDYLCPLHFGIGFTDLLLNIYETNSNNLNDNDIYNLRNNFYSRLIQHCQRVKNNLNNQNILKKQQISPKVIAFSGIRQWKCLFPSNSLQYKKSYINSYGIQNDRPSDWPIELSDSIVFLLPSSSGAAAMTTYQRETPYLELGRLVHKLTHSNTNIICSVNNKDNFDDRIKNECSIVLNDMILIIEEDNGKGINEVGMIEIIELEE